MDQYTLKTKREQYIGLVLLQRLYIKVKMTIFLKIDSTADRERQLIICMIILCYYIIQIIINTRVLVPFKMRNLASWFTVPFKMRILAFWFTRSNMWSSIPVIDYHEFHHILGNSEQAAGLIACWSSGLHRLLPHEVFWICKIIINKNELPRYYSLLIWQTIGSWHWLVYREWGI